jgi:hypothetical protein
MATVWQLNASITGTDSAQTGPTSCHLVSSANRLHLHHPDILQELKLTHNKHFLLMESGLNATYIQCGMNIQVAIPEFLLSSFLQNTHQSEVYLRVLLLSDLYQYSHNKM